MKLTIIVPVYNVEKYLNRCIDSIIKQLSEDIEVLLIDDGSTDNSGKICDEYTLKYKNINVYHKENGGLSSARNFGIARATGDFLLFLDSDDWLEQDSLSKFLKIIDSENTDVLVAKSRLVNDTEYLRDSASYSLLEGKYSTEEYIRLCTHFKCYTACAPYHICRRNLVNENNLTFLEGYIQEDELWTPVLLTKSKSVYFLNEYFYCHYIRPDSIVNGSSKEKEGVNLHHVTFKLYEYIKANYSARNILTDKMVNNYLRAYSLLYGKIKRDVQIPATQLFKHSVYAKTYIKVLLFALSHELYCKVATVKNKKSHNIFGGEK